MQSLVMSVGYTQHTHLFAVDISDWAVSVWEDLHSPG